VVGVVLLEHFEKHPCKAKDGIGGKAFGIGEMTDGIKGAKNIRRAVD
jgi:hypothetical protein